MTRVAGGAPPVGDPLALTPARAVVSTDDGRVRVTTWTFEVAGASTGPHRHGVDYVVVPVTGGRLSVTGADGSVSEMTQVAGAPYVGVAGTTHTVTSTSPHVVSFVEVELLS